MELSKQEMELFLLFPDLWSKNFFYKKFLTFTMESKTGVENRLMELSKQEMELFLLFPDHWSNNFFYKMFLNFIFEVKAGLENRK